MRQSAALLLDGDVALESQHLHSQNGHLHFRDSGLQDTRWDPKGGTCSCMSPWSFHNSTIYAKQEARSPKQETSKSPNMGAYGIFSARRPKPHTNPSLISFTSYEQIRLGYNVCPPHTLCCFLESSRGLMQVCRKPGVGKTVREQFLKERQLPSHHLSRTTVQEETGDQLPRLPPALGFPLAPPLQHHPQEAGTFLQARREGTFPHQAAYVCGNADCKSQTCEQNGEGLPVLRPLRKSGKG